MSKDLEYRARQVVKKQMLTFTKVNEKQLDDEIAQSESLHEDNAENMRLQQMQLQAEKTMQSLANGHGDYLEIGVEEDFFNIIEASNRVVCHFYSENCQVIDRHLSVLAKHHLETKFVKLNAEKSPCLRERLRIVVLPTLALVKDGNVVGLNDVGGTCSFTAEELEEQLAKAGVIEYSGGTLSQPHTTGCIVGQDELQVSNARCHSFQASFNSAIRALLVSCSQSDVMTHFSQFHPDVQNFMYKLYTLVIAQTHSNIKAEFQSICMETKVMDVLNCFDERESPGCSRVRNIPLREAVVKSKLKERDRLKEMLQQVDKEKLGLTSKIEELRNNDVNAPEELRWLDALFSKIRDRNMELSYIVKSSG